MEENKMKINVKIEVHCYQQDRLIDETFEAASMMILGTEAASCVKKNRSTEFSFDYNSETTLSDFRRAVLMTMFEGKDYYCELKFRIVGINDWLFMIEDPTQKFEMILSDNQIPVIENTIKVAIFISLNAAEYDRFNNLRYYMHSNENCGHNEPHVHVEVLGEKNMDVSIEILHPEIYKGKMPSKYLKQAQKKIIREQKQLLKFWNARTNGLKVDINQALGITEC